MSIADQFSSIRERHPGIMLMNYPLSSVAVAKGSFVMDAEYCGNRLIESYYLTIFVPYSFPNHLPRVYEESGKVPNEFEHLLSDGSLCLGTQADQLIQLQRNPTLLFFMDKIVVSYLYAVTYFNRYGQTPFPERPHGIDGIYDFYMDFFGLVTKRQVISWLFAVRSYHDNKSIPCPCGSGKEIHKCKHNGIFQKVSPTTIQCCMYDLQQIFIQKGDVFIE